MLSKQAISEFRIIYREKYGKELSISEATKQANNLIRLYKAVLPTLKSGTSITEGRNVNNIA